MPPTLRVVVAIWTVGVFKDCPDCFEALAGTWIWEGAIAALELKEVFGKSQRRGLAVYPSLGKGRCQSGWTCLLLPSPSL